MPKLVPKDTVKVDAQKDFKEQLLRQKNKVCIFTDIQDIQSSWNQLMRKEG